MPNNNNNTDIPLLSTTSFLHYIPTSSSDSTNELDFHLPSRTSLHGLTVAEWAGSKSKHSCKQNVYMLTTTNTISIIHTSSHNTRKLLS